jgi:hypothetical protein
MFEAVDDLPTIEGNVFLDRDGATFMALLNYLRNQREEMPVFDTARDEHLFFKELQYWELPDANFF